MTDSTIYSQASLQEGVAALDKAQKELNQLLEDLKAQLATSLGQWEDSARTAYQQVQDSWDKSALRQQEIVAAMPGLLSQISEGYQSTENKNTQIWG